MRIRPVVNCLRIIATITFIYFVYKRQTSSYVMQAADERLQKSKTFTRSKHIVLVIVVCPHPNNYEIRNEATVLLKSVIISAKLNNIPKVTIYFFVENMAREKLYFTNKIYEFGYPFSEFVLQLRFQSAVEAVPHNVQNEFITNSANLNLLRCTNVRLFIPSALPSEDAVLYLDTDVIVHGNLGELWNTWNLMDQEQIIGVGSDYEEGSYLAKWYKNSIYPKPRYLNAGVLLMNLTRMRNLDWDRKLLRIWNQYRYTIRNLNDQHVINMMLYINPNLLYRLPCQFNYMFQHCAFSSPCKTAQNNSLQIFHGAGGHFTDTKALKNVYQVYSRLNINNLNFNSNQNFRAVVHKSFNNNTYVKTMCHDILSDIIK